MTEYGTSVWWRARNSRELLVDFFVISPKVNKAKSFIAVLYQYDKTLAQTCFQSLSLEI